MSKVYITNASFKMITKSLRFKKAIVARENMLNDIYSDFENEFESNEFIDNIKEFYNTHEIRDIYFTKMILKDFDSLLKEIAHNEEIITEHVKKSNSIYAFKIKAPAFHSKIDCKWMKSDFENILIPENCRLNEATHKKAINWLEKHRNLSFEELNSKFKIEFECDCDLEKIKRSNSGDMQFENTQINIDTYEKAKENFIQMRMYFNGEFSKKVQNMKYASSYNLKRILKNNQNDLYYDTIIDFHSIKEATKDIIMNYYQNKYNIDLSFDKTLLESIGFRACRSCDSEVKINLSEGIKINWNL